MLETSEALLKFLSSLAVRFKPASLPALAYCRVQSRKRWVILVSNKPLNFSPDATTIQDVKAVWPAVVQFAGSIGIKL
jgi:hypothetical protein